MTKFLEQVLVEVRKLADDEQDRIAAELMAYLRTGDDGDLQLSEAQLAEVRRRRADEQRGSITLDALETRLGRSSV